MEGFINSVEHYRPTGFNYTICNIGRSDFIRLERERNDFQIISHWKRQRPIDQNHTNEIADYIRENAGKKEFFIPAIEIINIEGNTDFTIFDGQHRYEAFKTIYLYDDAKQTEGDIRLLIHIHDSVLNDREIYKLFISINRSKPVPMIYIDNKYASRIKRKIIKKIRNTFGDGIFSNVDNAKISHHINDDVLQLRLDDEYFDHLQKDLNFNFYDGNDIFNEMLEINDYIVDVMDNRDIKAYIRRWDNSRADATIDNVVARIRNYSITSGRPICGLPLMKNFSWLEYVGRRQDLPVIIGEI